MLLKNILFIISFICIFDGVILTACTSSSKQEIPSTKDISFPSTTSISAVTPLRLPSLESSENYLVKKVREREHEQAKIQAEKKRLVRQRELALLPIMSSSSISDTFVPGKVFRDRLQDGSLGPQMVWVKAGSFQMGDIQGGGYSDEKPAHSVFVNSFAIGRYEVTFAEYDKFVMATNGIKSNDFSGKKYHNHPVVNVSWGNAMAYAQWLSQQTGKQYRLPTEAEWEYAARAGSNTKYWWGNQIGSNKANCENDFCGDHFEYVAQVGSFAPNPFGLYDTVGNVWEWTCSEYEEKYNGKEKQCIAQNSTNLRVIRSGAWFSEPRDVRAAVRYGYPHVSRFFDVGFRLALSITGNDN